MMVALRARNEEDARRLADALPVAARDLGKTPGIRDFRIPFQSLKRLGRREKKDEILFVRKQK